jgi:hypothetical protein
MHFLKSFAFLNGFKINGRFKMDLKMHFFLNAF